MAAERNMETRGPGGFVLALIADAEDIGLTIHPHPTLSETIYFSAEMAEGTITDMLPAKR